MKQLNICADDFGMNSEINAGILDLAQQGRLSAVSCLVHGRAFASDAARLANAPVQVGLHLNLTEAFNGSIYHRPLHRLILECFTGIASPIGIRAAIEQQFDTFTAGFGRRPDYVDGHQHVHQLPIVRDCLLQVLSERCLDHLPWLRSTRRAAGWDFPMDTLKAGVIQALGEAGLRRRCEAGRFRMNSGLLGVYGFAGGEDAFLRRLRAWVADYAEGDLIMCHPAAKAGKGDPLGAQRRAEFSVLGSDYFADLLQEREAGINVPFDYSTGDVACRTRFPGQPLFDDATVASSSSSDNEDPVRGVERPAT